MISVDPGDHRPETDPVLGALLRYWPSGEEVIRALPLPRVAIPTACPPRMQWISLPEWAADLTVQGGILVPEGCLGPGDGIPWLRADWLGVARWYLNGSAERVHESRHGPVHSYSFRLTGWDPMIWRYAWVNRIGLFLRRWASRLRDVEEEELFGPLPSAEFILTHDVDAIRKMTPVRIKQTVFHLFNALRCLSRGSVLGSLRKLCLARRFLLSRSDYWCFERIMEMERALGLRSVFLFHGGGPLSERTWRQSFIDPVYDIREPWSSRILGELVQGGWYLGVHPSVSHWSAAADLAREKARVEEAAGVPVTRCRQHWLMFGWQSTWKAQAQAGLREDFTLAFNDRPGFRNGSALRFRPPDPESGHPLDLEVVPTVLMDSQLYDYADLSPPGRLKLMRHFVGEVERVHGVAALLWHQQVVGTDYGWAGGYRCLLATLKGLPPELEDLDELLDQDADRLSVSGLCRKS